MSSHGETARNVNCGSQDFEPIRSNRQRRRDEDLPEIYIRMNGEIKPLHWTLIFEDWEEFELLLRNGEDPNWTDKNGMTPLHLLSMQHRDNGLAKMIFDVSNKKHRILQVNIQDIWGNTALHLAVDNGLEVIIKLLLRNGADPNLPNKDGFTALHIMCQKFCDDNLMKVFFEICDEIGQTVQIDVRDKLGRTPLQLALSYGLNMTSEFLLKRGADPNSADVEGFTSLHTICQRFIDDDLINTFFKICDEVGHTVQINTQDNMGRTPLQLAVTSLKVDVVEYLLNRGADVTEFVFPTANSTYETFQRQLGESMCSLKLRLASDALIIIKRLQYRRYDVKQSVAMEILTFLSDYGLLEKSTDVDTCWYHDENFLNLAKGVVINDGMSFDDIYKLIPEETSEPVAHVDCSDFVPAEEYDFSIEIED